MDGGKAMATEQVPERKGMLLTVYRPAPAGDPLLGRDATAGGISSKASKVVVTRVRHEWENGPSTEDVPADMRVFAPSPDAPEVTLVIRDNGHVRWLHLEPVNGPPADQTWWMSGGNYAGTSDSRWSRLTGNHGEMVRIHDRSDTWETYNRLST